MVDQQQYNLQNQQVNHQTQNEMPKIKQCLYLNTDQNNQLFCLKCVVTIPLDLKKVVMLEEIFSQDSRCIIKNWPPLQDQNLFEFLKKINNVKDNNLSEQIIQINSLFSQLRKDANKIIDNYEKNIIAHINQIEDNRQIIFQIYNQISQTEEIKTQFWNQQNNLKELDNYLKNLILSKQKQSQDNYLILKDSLDNLTKCYQISSFDRIKENLTQEMTQNLKPIIDILNSLQLKIFESTEKNSDPLQLQKNEKEEQNQMEFKQELLQINKNNYQNLGKYINYQKIKIILNSQTFDSWKQFHLQDLKQLSVELKCLTQLTHLELNIEQNSGLEKGISFLSEGFKCLKRLNHLTMNLNYLNIGDEGLLHISEGLKSLINLTDLTFYLNRNSIGDNGLYHLSEGLKSLAMLNCLAVYLNENRIQDKGLQSLSESLKILQQLNDFTVDLKKNSNISFKGILPLVEGLNSLTSFTNLKFHLPHNQFTSDEVQSMMKLLKIKTIYDEQDSVLKSLKINNIEDKQESIFSFSNFLKPRK